MAKAAEEQEDDVVGSQVSNVLMFPSSARGEDVGETKCCLFCLASLRFTNKSHRIEVVGVVILRFVLIFRFSCGPHSIFLAGKRNTSGERYTSGRQDLLQASSRSNMTRNVTSTSNVTVQKWFTTVTRRFLERDKLYDVDEENVYRTCTGGSTRVPDGHR